MIIVKVFVYRGIFKLRMCLIWLVKIKIVVLVVKSLMIGFDKYIVIKLSFRRFIINCRKGICNYYDKFFISKLMF